MSYWTSQNARELIRRIKKVIANEICVTDTEGRVIAGTGAFEAGKILTGARRAVDGQEPQILYREIEDEKMGIFFPLRFQEQIEGVVFIAGPVNDVMQVGQIVVSLAEVLMENAAILEMNATKEKRMNDFLFEWTTRTAQEYDEYFYDLAAYYGIDLQLKRRAVCVGLQRIRYSLLDRVRALLKTGEYIARQTIDSFLLLMLDDGDMDSRLRYMLSISQDFGCCTVGVSEKTLSVSVDTAYRLHRIARIIGTEDRLIHYEQYALECMLCQTKGTQAVERIREAVRGHDGDGNLIRTIHAYAMNGADQKAVCQRLFIHRNTLNYRLDKIQELTGLNPRVPREMMLLYTAALVEKMETKPDP